MFKLKYFFLILLVNLICSYSQWNISIDDYHFSFATDIVKVDNNNDFLVISHVKEESISSRGKILLTKVTELGEVISSTFLESSDHSESCSLLKEVENDQFIITGYDIENKNGLVYKIEEDGTIIWRKEIGTIGEYEYIGDFIVLEDGNYLLSILNPTHCEQVDMRYIKLDINGNIIWSNNHHTGRTFGSGAKFFESLTNNSFVSFGSCIDPETSLPVIFIITFDNMGNLLTEEHIDDATSRYKLNDAKRVSDGGFILTGRKTIDAEMTSKWFIIKLNESLGIDWEKEYYGDAYQANVALKIIETGDLEFVIAGERNQEGDINSNIFKSDYAITKINNLGEIIWEVLLPGNDLGKRAYSIVETDNNDFITVGSTDADWLKSDIFIVAIDNNGNHNVNIADSNSLEISNYELKQNYPNPFNPKATINYILKKSADVRIVIYNISGEKVASTSKEAKSPGNYNFIFDGSKFNTGLYFYSLEVDGKRIDTKSMILLK